MLIQKAGRGIEMRRGYPNLFANQLGLVRAGVTDRDITPG